MSDKLSERDTALLDTPLSEAEVRLLCEERWTYIQELLADKAALEQRVETAEVVIERRDAKIKRQAEQITRLETSRASLREALAALPEYLKE